MMHDSHWPLGTGLHKCGLCMICNSLNAVYDKSDLTRRKQIICMIELNCICKEAVQSREIYSNSHIARQNNRDASCIRLRVLEVWHVRRSLTFRSSLALNALCSNASASHIGTHALLFSSCSSCARLCSAARALCSRADDGMRFAGCTFRHVQRRSVYIALVVRHSCAACLRRAAGTYC